MVNFGVSFLHLKLTEKTEKPIEEVIPKINPTSELLPLVPSAMIIIPIVAIKIEIQTFKEIFSFKNKKASNAVNGIAAKHNNVIAAEVLVIEYMKETIATPKPNPPIKPDVPTLK